MAIDPLLSDAGAVVADIRRGDPDVVVYLGLGAASHAVATAILDAGWDVPVLANSALMFGYVRADWRDAWATWEYVDTIADDNAERERLATLDPAARPARSGARPTTSDGSSLTRRSVPRASTPPACVTASSGSSSCRPRRDRRARSWASASGTTRR